jgi:hypothetical protein
MFDLAALAAERFTSSDRGTEHVARDVVKAFTVFERLISDVRADARDAADHAVARQ